jgi:4,5-dihydroxyphthalate decarboxylase
MAELELTLALVPNYDRTGPLLNYAVQPEGIRFVAETFTAAGEIFRRVAQRAEWDVAEMSVSTFMIMCAQHDARYVGLPIFPSRSFRHQSMWVRRDSEIIRPEQLAGKRIGVTEYQQTATMWVRGILADEYGVRLEDVQWVTGGLESFEAERYPIELPPRFKLQTIPPDQGLDGMLQRGSIDALIGARPPPSFLRGEPHIRRLIPDYRPVEREYFRRTGYFPIMHMMVLRRSVYEQHPWVVNAIYQAFEQVKAAGIARLWDPGSPPCSLPWMMADMEEVRDLFGGDAFPYGVGKNRGILEYMLRMAYDQGVLLRQVRVEELFPAEALTT